MYFKMLVCPSRNCHLITAPRLETFSMTKLTNSSIKSVNELALLSGFWHNIWQLHLLAYPLVSVQKHS